jgi:hypothetical protein
VIIAVVVVVFGFLVGGGVVALLFLNAVGKMLMRSDDAPFEITAAVRENGGSSRGETPPAETVAADEVGKSPIIGKWHAAWWDSDGDLTVSEFNFLDDGTFLENFYWPDLSYGGYLYEGGYTLTDGALLLKYETITDYYENYSEEPEEDSKRTFGDYYGDTFAIDSGGEERTYSRGDFKRDSMPAATANPPSDGDVTDGVWSTSWRDGDGDLVVIELEFYEDGTFSQYTEFPDFPSYKRHLYTGVYALSGSELTLVFDTHYSSYDEFETYETEDWTQTASGDFYGKRFVIDLGHGERTYTRS